MSWALPQALGYYGDSVAIGVATLRRSHGCDERFGLPVGPPFVLCHPHWDTVCGGSSPLEQFQPATASSRVSASFPRDSPGPGRTGVQAMQPCPWAASLTSLLVVDAPPYSPFTRRAIVPSALSGEGVRGSRGSTRKAVRYPPPSSGANLHWQNHSCLTWRTHPR